MANVNESVLWSRISDERVSILDRRSRTTLDRFFSASSQEPSSGGLIPRKSLNQGLHAVAVVIYAFITEALCSQVSSPILQGFVDVFGGRVQFSSFTATSKMLYETYSSVCRILRTSVSSAKTACITVDGWSAALGAPILGVIWHCIDDNWNMRCVPIATLNMGIAIKTGQQLRFMEEILEQTLL